MVRNSTTGRLSTAKRSTKRSKAVASPMKMSQADLANDITYVAQSNAMAASHGRRGNEYGSPARDGSPSRLSPTLNRALARELYVD